MKRVVVLGSCCIRRDWCPPGAETYDRIVGNVLRRQGEPVESVGVSMTPAAYTRLNSYPFSGEPFDYLAMEVTSSWLTVRTIARRVARTTPRPLARGFVGATRALQNWAGGPQNVWVRRSGSLRARIVRLIRSGVARFITPRSFATPDEFETFLVDTAQLCREKGAGFVVLFAGVRSSNPRHKWAADMVNDLERRLRRLQVDEGFAVVSLVPLLSVYPNPELMSDGLHPNKDGHTRFASAVVGAINEMEKGKRSFWREVGPEEAAVDPAEVWSLPETSRAATGVAG